MSEVKPFQTDKKMNKENTYKRPENYIHITSGGVGFLMPIDDAAIAQKMKEDLMELSKMEDRQSAIRFLSENLFFAARMTIKMVFERARWKGIETDSLKERMLSKSMAEALGFDDYAEYLSSHIPSSYFNSRRTPPQTE